VKRGRGWFALFGSMAAVSLAAFAMVSLGSVDTTVFPSTLNSNPGGTLALYRLLEESGIPVKRVYAPPTTPDASAGVVVVFDTGIEIFGSNPSVYDVVDDYGGADAIVVVSLPRLLPSRRSATRYEKSWSIPAFDRAATIVAEGETSGWSGDHELLRSANVLLASYKSIGDRIDVQVSVGGPFLNRFIGSEDNPELCISSISAFLEPGKTVVFPEYALGIRAPETLFSKLGAPFSAGLIQLLLAFGLLIYSLGKRFGYPDDDIPRKPGTADHISALGAAFERGRCTDIVLDTAVSRAVRLISKKLEIASDIDQNQRIESAPEPVRSALLAIRDRPHRKPPQADAARLLTALDNSLAQLDSLRR
jgi:hypothetical protein